MMKKKANAKESNDKTQEKERQELSGSRR